MRSRLHEGQGVGDPFVRRAKLGPEQEQVFEKFWLRDSNGAKSVGAGKQIDFAAATQNPVKTFQRLGRCCQMLRLRGYQAPVLVQSLDQEPPSSALGLRNDSIGSKIALLTSVLQKLGSLKL